MMTKTMTTRRTPEYRITQDGDGTVTLTLSGRLLAYLDSGEQAETQTRRYVLRGRYVYEVNPCGDDRQVCDGLGSIGYTLTATPGSLPDVIRREVRYAQSKARRFWT